MGRKRRAWAVPSVDFESMPYLLNESQCSQVCGVSVAFLRLSRSEGPRGERTPGPKFVRVNRSIFYPKDEVAKWVKGLERRLVV